MASATSADIICAAVYSLAVRRRLPAGNRQGAGMIVEPNEAVRERVLELRRAIHRHPELGFEEHETAALIEGELDALGIEHRRVAGTGVVGVIRARAGGHVAALRADMDALPITERTGLPYASQVAGKMHACGHDAHTAMLLGAARVLTAQRERLDGSVVLIFQPAEEGPGGAEPMIAQGVLDAPKVEAIAMLHVDPRLEAGAISITPGPVNASADELYLTVRGRGGHGAYPHTAVDAIPAAAAIVLALQNIAARETDPLKSVVVTIGTIAGGYRNNVIADEVQLSGTLRALDPQVRDGLAARVTRIAEGVASAYNASVDVRIVRGYPPVVNDPSLAIAFAAYMKAHAAIRVESLPPTMGGEDFAYFAQRVPGVHVRLGIRSEAAGATHPGHSAEFRIDEAALPVGVQTLVAFATAVGSGEIGG
jgi:amidohydrolase